MRIGAYKLEYGGWYPPTVRQYVHTSVENLAESIRKIIGKKYEVIVKRSKNSEATYIRIKDMTDFVETTISFRNHGNFSHSAYDHHILLYKYTTWTACKRDFIARILPEVMHQLNTVKWAERQITNVIAFEMTRALAEVGATEVE
jgi:hypothetical protein